MRKKTLIILTVSIVLCIGSCASMLAYLGKDEPPPNDADLILAPLNIPDEDNALTYFKLAGEKVWRPEDWEIFDAMVDGEGWDDAQAAKILKENDEAFRLLARGVACSRTDFPNEPFGAEAPFLSQWGRLSKILSLRCKYLLKHGKHEDAFQEALNATRFGHLIENGRGQVIYYLIGIAVKSRALATLRSMLPHTTLDSRKLAGICRELKDYAFNDECLADAFRREYMMTSQTFDDVFQTNEATFRVPVASDGNIRFVTVPKLGYLFLPNQTRRLFADFLRAFIENVPKRPPDWSLPDAYEAFRPPSGVLGALCTRNAAGRSLCGMMAPGFKKMALYRCKSSVSLHATRLLIALKCHKLETGALPDILDALVPKYIDEVPKDDFDGRPMRYLPERKIIYSVGKDLKDDDGDEEADVVFPVDF